MALGGTVQRADWAEGLEDGGPEYMLVTGQREGVLGARGPKDVGKRVLCGAGMALRQVWWLLLVTWVLRISPTCLSAPTKSWE